MGEGRERDLTLDKKVFEVSLQSILYTLQGLIQLNYQKERYVQVSRSVKNSAVALTPQGGGLNVPLDPLRALNPPAVSEVLSFYI